MVWHWSVDYPLPEPIMTRLAYAYTVKYGYNVFQYNKILQKLRPKIKQMLNPQDTP